MKERLVGTALERPARSAVNAARRISRRETPEAAKARLYDRQTLEIARRVLKPDSNTIDVGAHRGEILAGLVKIAPQGHHVAVEPLPRYASTLRRRFPNVTVHQVALAAQQGTARFRYAHDAPEESSLDGLGHDDVGTVAYFDVTVLTLDDVAPDRVDFVKIDAEGAELLILKGAPRVLSLHPFIAFEIGGDHHSELYDLIAKHGYKINLLSRWLAGEPPPPNVHALRHDVRGEYFFLAYA